MTAIGIEHIQCVFLLMSADVMKTISSSALGDAVVLTGTGECRGEKSSPSSEQLCDISCGQWWLRVNTEGVFFPLPAVICVLHTQQIALSSRGPWKVHNVYRSQYSSRSHQTPYEG